MDKRYSHLKLDATYAKVLFISFFYYSVLVQPFPASLDAAKGDLGSTSPRSWLVCTLREDVHVALVMKSRTAVTIRDYR